MLAWRVRFLGWSRLPADSLKDLGEQFEISAPTTASCEHCTALQTGDDQLETPITIGISTWTARSRKSVPHLRKSQ
jgi:hypothetical protein